MITAEEYRSLASEGFIPGPDESEDEFIRRVDLLRGLNGHKRCLSVRKLGGEFRYLTHHLHSLGVTLNWIPLVYSNRKLLPWQGAVSWTTETPEGVPFSFIQLRRGFKGGRGVFNRQEEVLCHEAVHLMRATFNEPRFEEILAYFHSTKGWRSLLGPIFRKPSQALFFFSLSCASLATQVAAPFFLSDSPLFPYIKFCLLIPSFDLLLRFIFLIRDRHIFKKTLRTLRALFPRQNTPFAIALHLKDSEIQSFAKRPRRELLSYIREKSAFSPRWQQIISQFS